MKIMSSFFRFRARKGIFVATLALFGSVPAARAHPLGNFTINQYARIEVGDSSLRVRYVVDRAEIPTFQELRHIGNASAPSQDELAAYAKRAAATCARNLSLTVDGSPVALTVADAKATLRPGAGGLPTLRLESDLKAPTSFGGSPTLRFEDKNNPTRVGWHEIVIVPAKGIRVFNSSAYGNAVTDELKIYPEDRISAPLDERTAQLSWTTGAAPPGATGLRLRDGRPVAAPVRDRFAELAAVRNLTPPVVLLGLLIAFIWGAGHALTPGHGKTIVGAYLIGARGTPWHAVYLGATVTITHTLGVFALGLVTLFASQYILPERLFPALGFVSGGLIVVLGVNLFIQRLSVLLGVPSHEHSGDPTQRHRHGGLVHSHLPPGADGAEVNWRSLLALGISGGLLPCPSALVVLLSAVALHRVAYGLALVIAFSLGLAGTLTLIGLLFLHARRLLSAPRWNVFSSPLLRILPVFSAVFVAGAGAFLCYGALQQGDFLRFALPSLETMTGGGKLNLASLGAVAILGLGFLFGLKHATETDHVIAVSTIVSEQRNVMRAALVGALWGVGHTVSLVGVGVIVLAFRVAIPERLANWLEFGVALMIITLAVLALLRTRSQRINGVLPATDDAALPAANIGQREALRRIGWKPFIVGAVHGLAGSGTLTLLVLTQIPSLLVGLCYLAVFGVGSILGMLLMSGMVGLPFVFSANRLGGIHLRLQTAAAAFSLLFGFWYAYQTVFAVL